MNSLSFCTPVWVRAQRELIPRSAAGRLARSPGWRDAMRPERLPIQRMSIASKREGGPSLPRWRFGLVETAAGDPLTWDPP